jgi:hypothetical protein
MVLVFHSGSFPLMFIFSGTANYLAPVGSLSFIVAEIVDMRYRKY